MIRRSSSIAAGFALCAVATLAPGATFAGDEPQSFEMRPMMATSIVTGGKHVLTYFRNGDGVCHLTLMIEEVTGNPASRASRLDVAVKAGANAVYDAGNGRGLSFGCNRSADAMSASKLDNTAWRSDD